MAAQSRGPAFCTRSRTLSNAGSFGASSEGAHARTAVVPAHSLSAPDGAADQADQVQGDAEEEREEAVEGGVVDDGEMSSTVSTDLNSGVGLVRVDRSMSEPIGTGWINRVGLIG